MREKCEVLPFLVALVWRLGRRTNTFRKKSVKNREVLQNEFQYDFQKGPREISAGMVCTVFTCIIAFNTVITVPV